MKKLLILLAAMIAVSTISVAQKHVYVDLGLPSGTLWATTNVGADNPEDYGDYFAWGETKPKSDYSWETYKYANGAYNKLTKYNTSSSYGSVDNKKTPRLLRRCRLSKLGQRLVYADN